MTLVAAFLGGLVSLLSPCVLPLVPAYFSLVTGLDVAEVTRGDAPAPAADQPTLALRCRRWV